MADDFAKFLDTLIDGETQRVAALAAERKREEAEAAREKNRLGALRPQIFGKMQEVSTMWGRLAGDINTKSRQLGFSADVSGWEDDRAYYLQVNFHPHGKDSLRPLLLTASFSGEGVFTPNRATMFDFLRAGDGVFEGNLENHVRDLFQQIRNDAMAASGQG